MAKVSLEKDKIKFLLVEGVHQKALFAMASVKLSQAGSDGEVAAALDMLDVWAKKSPPGGSGEDARRSLFGMGVLIALRKRGAFMEYLLEQQPPQSIATTSRPGWPEPGVNSP